nr:hypothetical protein [Actinomycetota bacterium]NIU70212.1 hypothetical protein [Actinomycetota bacterium]NIW32098.1 hypothetical protein [Actinomycetota bacterium]NIX24331.1 hypothetical protein [Actinomycetota bacterium]
MGGPVPTSDPEQYGVSRERGFVPDEPPLAAFDDGAGRFARQLDELAGRLP